MQVYLTFSLLFILPFIVLPIFPLAFEPPKVLIAQALILILATFSLSRLKFPPPKSSLNLLIPCALILLVSILNLFLSSNFNLFGNIFRLQGPLLLWFLILFAIVSSKVDFVKLPNYLFPLTLFALLVATIIMGSNSAGRAIATLGEPNALATTALFFLPFAFLNQKHKYISVISLFLASAIILLSGSRSSLFALFVLVTYVVLVYPVKLPKLYSLIICLCIIVSSQVFPFLEQAGWYENRSEIWKTALASGLESPLIGKGFGNIQDSLHQTALSLDSNIKFQVVDSSHNFLLDYFLQGGLISLISLFILIFYTFRSLLHQNKNIEILALLGLITCLLFNPVSVVNLLAFWYLLGKSRE